MKRFIYLTVLAASVLLSACTPEPRLVILHFNDTHSYLEPVRSGPMKGHGGAIERAAFVDSVRCAEGEDRVLLLHAGDFDQGTSYFSELDGDVEISVINAMRYDCITLGNHEFDNGIEELTRRLANLDSVPVVCANLDLSPFELGKYVKPYAVIERGGSRIGIIGLAPDISSCVAKTVSSRIPQLDDVECVNRYTETLRAEEKCDLVILLTHIGYDEDLALVPQTHGVDLLVGGHSHTLIDEPAVVNDADGKPVTIVTDWCWGLEAGVMKLY